MATNYYKVNGKPSAEAIEKYDDNRNTFYRWQNPEWEIAGEYTQSWGMIFSSAEEAREEAEDWGLTEEEAVLPGKSCTKTFDELMSYQGTFGKDYVVLVFRGYDTGVSGHDGEWVAEYDYPVEVWGYEDVMEYVNR